MLTSFSASRRAHSTRRSRATVLTAGALLVAFGAAACGSSSSSAAKSPGTTAPAADQPAVTATSPSAGSDASSGSTATTQQMAFQNYTSTKSFDDTVAALKKQVASSGMMMLGTLNQAGALKTTGLNLAGAETFFVGNPVKGKMFFQTNPAIGVAAPLRIYVWADSNGTAHVGFYDPAAEFAAVDPALADGGKQMAMAADMIAKGATGASSATAGAPVAVAFNQMASTKSFDDTVAALKKQVASSGMMVLGTLNQAGALKTTGLDLKGAQTFFVGNPVKGKMFFQSNPAIGVSIPLTMYVWADNNGTAHVGYLDPAAEFTAVDPGMGDGGKQMAMAAGMIAKGATQ